MAKTAFVGFGEVNTPIDIIIEKCKRAEGELKAQGLDLSGYCKKQVRRYTYEVKNYKDADLAVYANVIVYRHRVIGGDISASGEGGFVLPFTAFEAEK